MLFKNAIALEQAAKLETVVLDKARHAHPGEREVVAVVTADDVNPAGPSPTRSAS